MKPEFNYESVPFDFSHCFCGQCKVADKCPSDSGEQVFRACHKPE